MKMDKMRGNKQINTFCVVKNQNGDKDENHGIGVRVVEI
jgi:hypothetical protein